MFFNLCIAQSQTCYKYRIIQEVFNAQESHGADEYKDHLLDSACVFHFQSPQFIIKRNKVLMQSDAVAARA